MFKAVGNNKVYISNNYRSILLICSTYKVFNKILENRLALRRKVIEGY